MLRAIDDLINELCICLGKAPHEVSESYLELNFMIYSISSINIGRLVQESMDSDFSLASSGFDLNFGFYEMVEIVRHGKIVVVSW